MKIIYMSGSQPGAILPSSEHLAMTGEVFGCHSLGEGLLLVCSE